MFEVISINEAFSFGKLFKISFKALKLEIQNLELYLKFYFYYFSFFTKLGSKSFALSFDRFSTFSI